MQQKRLALIVSAGVGIISLFLPWISYFSFNISLFNDYVGSTTDGWLYLGLSIGIIVVSSLGGIKNTLSKKQNLSIATLSALGILFFLLFFFKTIGIANVGFGAYLYVITAIINLLLALLFKDKIDLKNIDLNQAKQDLVNSGKESVNFVKAVASATKTTIAEQKSQTNVISEVERNNSVEIAQSSENTETLSEKSNTVESTQPLTQEVVNEQTEVLEPTKSETHDSQNTTDNVKNEQDIKKITF